MSFDIFDQEPKRENEPRRAAAVVLQTARGEVLLLHRKPHDRAFTGWCLPGGKQEPGDKNLLDTALIELQQETGLQFDSAEFLQSGTTTDQQGQQYEVSAYQITLPNEERLPVVLSDEHDDFGWFDPCTVIAESDQYPLAGENTLRVLLLVKPPLDR